MRHYIIPAHASASEVEVIDSANPAGGYALNPRWDLGTVYGTAQVALAIVADATGSDGRALKTYMEFKHRVLSRHEGEELEISEEDVKQAVAQIERERQRRPAGSLSEAVAGRGK